jgi:hypothetical protein
MSTENNQGSSSQGNHSSSQRDLERAYKEYRKGTEETFRDLFHQPFPTNWNQPSVHHGSHGVSNRHSR